MLMVGSYLLITFYDYLQGNKVFIVDAYSLTTNIHYSKEVGKTHPSLLITLLGRLKS